jgi:plastocyanin
VDLTTNHAVSRKELAMRAQGLVAPIAVMAAVMALWCGTARAADVEMQLVIKNHRFEPSELKVPVGQRIKLTVHNQDRTPEEFESHALNREKVIPAGAKTTIFIGPLKAGRYEFVGEYHEATAKGAVIAE